jgi:nucleoside-triphosphatase
VAAVKRAIAESSLVVIDEIGKMELFSAAFKAAVEQALQRDKKVLGSIMFQPHPWADGIKRHPRVSLLTVTRGSGAQVFEEVIRWLGSVGL